MKYNPAVYSEFMKTMPSIAGLFVAGGWSFADRAGDAAPFWTHRPSFPQPYG